jgi:thioredoxin 1
VEISGMSFEKALFAAVALVISGTAWIVYDVTRPMRGEETSVSGNSALAAAIRSSTTKQPLMLEFYADWCGPCKVVGPMVEELSRELKGKALVVRINIDEDPKLARSHGVRGVPTFIAYKSGRETGREVGGIPKERMRELLGL